MPQLPAVIEAPATGINAYDQILDQYEIGDTSDLRPVKSCPYCSAWTQCKDWAEYTELTTNIKPNWEEYCGTRCYVCNQP